MTTFRRFRRQLEPNWTAFILRQRSPRRRYLVAVLSSASGLALTWLFHYFDSAHLYSFNLAAVVFSALYGGRGPAVLSAALSAIVVDYLFVEPLFQVFRTPHAFARIVLYFLMAFAVSLVMAQLRTAMREIEEARHIAADASRARENLLAIVSHDLKNPIAATLINATVMRRLITEKRDAEAQLRVADSIHSAANRMNHLVKDLLDVAKIESGAFVIDPAPTSSKQLLLEAVSAMSELAAERSVRVRTVAPIADDVLLCDSQQILRALSNLISNAIKFSPESGEVALTAESTPSGIRFSVKDHGPGIAVCEIPHLFDRYWQARSTAALGTGLGLFITKGIVDAHGGQIRVDSVHGSGSTFHFTIPYAPGVPKGLTSAAKPGYGASDGKGGAPLADDL